MWRSAITDDREELLEMMMMRCMDGNFRMLCLTA